MPKSRLRRRTSSQMFAAAGRIQTGGRFVQEQDVRLVHQRQGQVQTAAHAPAVRADTAIDGVLDLHQLDKLVCTGRSLLLRKAEQPSLQSQQLERFHGRVQPDLLQGHAGNTAHLAGLLHDVVAADEGAACGRQGQRGQDLDRRALARAVGSKETIDLAGLDRQ